MTKFTLAATDLFENVSAIISIHHFPSGRHRLRFLRNTVRYGFGMKLKMNYVQTCFSVHIKKNTAMHFHCTLVRIHEKFYHRVTFTDTSEKKSFSCISDTILFKFKLQSHRWKSNSTFKELLMLKQDILTSIIMSHNLIISKINKCGRRFAYVEFTRLNFSDAFKWDISRRLEKK